MTSKFAAGRFPCDLSLLFLSIWTALSPSTQADRIPMDPEHWHGPADKVEFLKHHGTEALRVRRGAGPVALAGVAFRDGMIEFDFQPLQPDFVSLFFRRQSADESGVRFAQQ